MRQRMRQRLRNCCLSFARMRQMRSRSQAPAAGKNGEKSTSVSGFLHGITGAHLRRGGSRLPPIGIKPSWGQDSRVNRHSLDAPDRESAFSLKPSACDCQPIRTNKKSLHSGRSVPGAWSTWEDRNSGEGRWAQHSRRGPIQKTLPQTHPTQSSPDRSSVAPY